MYGIWESLSADNIMQHWETSALLVKGADSPYNVDANTLTWLHELPSLLFPSGYMPLPLGTCSGLLQARAVSSCWSPVQITLMTLLPDAQKTQL